MAHAMGIDTIRFVCMSLSIEISESLTQGWELQNTLEKGLGLVARAPWWGLEGMRWLKLFLGALVRKACEHVWGQAIVTETRRFYICKCYLQ